MIFKFYLSLLQCFLVYKLLFDISLRLYLKFIQHLSFSFNHNTKCQSFFDKAHQLFQDKLHSTINNSLI
jgi:hypothetical protein